MITSDDVRTQRVGNATPSIRFASGTLPETHKPLSVESSQTGVSTNNVLCRKEITGTKSSHWYALRTTYGREKKAYDYIIAHNGIAFYPTITTVKMVKGKRKSVEESRLPNIFFAYGTEEEISSFVYDNVNLPFLRFYYSYHHEGKNLVKKPLVVPGRQIESLMIICASETEDIIVTSNDIEKFKTGQAVRVIRGAFSGVVGRVARYNGQQRVGVVVDGLLTAATAYIPSAFLEHIE